MEMLEMVHHNKEERVTVQTEKKEQEMGHHQTEE